MSGEKKLCAWCYHARMRTDICGIYCTGGFENPDGTCERFKSWQDHKRDLHKRKEKGRGKEAP